jgi:hypothetical protein
MLRGEGDPRFLKAARDFAAAATGVIIVVPSATKERNDLVVIFASQLAAASPNKKYITYYMYGNTAGVNAALDQAVPGHISQAEMVKGVEAGELKALLLLGEDLSATYPALADNFKRLKFVARSDFFGGGSAVNPAKLVLLPLASQHEGVVAPKVGAKTNAEIIEMLLGEKLPGGEKLSPARGEKIDLQAKLQEAEAIKGADQAAIEPITHFGNNALVGNFFWFRVNRNG